MRKRRDGAATLVEQGQAGETSSIENFDEGMLIFGCSGGVPRHPPSRLPRFAI